MVLEEMAAHQARSYPGKYDKVTEALATLRGLVPWELESSPLDMERFLDHWRGAYREIFEVIETSDAALRKGYQREAQALPPAKRSRELSVGGRDVAIWFSLLEFLEQNPDEHVYFVTNNTSDFGDGTNYPYPMNEDVHGLEGRLTLLKDFEQVVSRFTTEVSGKEAEDAAAELLTSQSVREGMAQAAARLNTLTGYAGLGDANALERWYAWSGTPEVELLNVTDVTGHAIEGDVWYTAKAQWLLYGPAVDEMEALSGYIACVWEVKILFSARDDETPTLLAWDEPSPPDTGDESCMRILHGLKKRVADIAAAATRNLLAAQAPVERMIAEQLAPTLAKLDLATSQLARHSAWQLALVDDSVQRLAQKIAADQMKLLNSPVQQFARQMAANRAALTAAVDSPGLRAAQRFAASMPKLDIATSIPRISVPIAGLQPHGGESEDYDEQSKAPDTQGPLEAEPDETTTADDSPDE